MFPVSVYGTDLRALFREGLGLVIVIERIGPRVKCPEEKQAELASRLALGSFAIVIRAQSPVFRH